MRARQPEVGRIVRSEPGLAGNAEQIYGGDGDSRDGEPARGVERRLDERGGFRCARDFFQAMWAIS